MGHAMYCACAFIFMVLVVGVPEADAGSLGRTNRLLGLATNKNSESSLSVINEYTTTSSSNQQRQLSKSAGSFRILILLVRFTDHKDRTLPPPSHFQSLCDNEMRPYLSAQSAGLFDPIACVVPEWIDTDNTEAFYAGGISNYQGSNKAAGMFVPVLQKLEQQKTDWNWSELFDKDMDGNLDSVLVIHSGHASEHGPNCGFDRTTPPGNRIQSQGHRGSDSAWMKSDQSIGLSGFAIASAFHLCSTEKAATMGTPTHELLHTFGTPDLYDLGSSHGKLGGTGLYDIMSNSNGPGGSGIAAGVGPFTKEKIGWVEPTLIEYDGVYEIRAASRGNEIYKITKGFGVDEYLLIENREPLDDDAGLPGGGLLIYHVDNMVQFQDTAGYFGQPGWPGNGNHYRVAVLQADGNYDLEQGVNNGDAGDYWVAGMTLAPGGNGNFPNSDSYQNGNIQKTGITITDISQPGLIMTFRVAGLGANPNAPATTDPPTTKAPATAPPTTKAPTAETPTTNAPTTQAPSTLAPVAAPTSPSVPQPTQSPVDGAGAVIALSDDPSAAPARTLLFVAYSLLALGSFSSLLY